MAEYYSDRSKYDVVIGLEVHVEMSTKTKIFCGCSTAFGAEPNTQTCPVCTGMPGVLPVLNEQVVQNAIAAGLATNCEITQNCKFDRKNYFYPDLPKAFQTSQLYLPICRNGWVEINGGNGKKKVRIHQIHMEEDAGKLSHHDNTGETFIDYNRCGVPLMEIVSEPDMTSATEACAYMEALAAIMSYLGVSDCKLEEGSMRGDINVSIKPKGSSVLGTRTETKNLNSFKAITRAIEWEIDRQIDLLENGEKVVQETRRWDDEKGIGYTMRSKENAHDYRYFPEPDLAPMHISDKWIAEVKAKIPELPQQKQARYLNEWQLSEYDAGMIVRSKALALFCEETVALCNEPKEVVNFLMGDGLRLLNENGLDAKDMPFAPKQLSDLVSLVVKGSINKTTAKAVFEKIFRENIDPIEYVKANNLEMVSDEEELVQMVADVIAANPKSVADYKGGKKAALGFLVGQIMRATKGRANAARVNELIREMLQD